MVDRDQSRLEVGEAYGERADATTSIVACGRADERMGVADGTGSQPGRQTAAALGHGSSVESASRIDPWGDYEIIPCRDGKYRRIPQQPQSPIQCMADGLQPCVDASGAESDSFPLSTTKEARTGLLRGLGNSILPHLGAEFIMSYLYTL